MEMYFKRMKDEWTGLVEQADPPIRAKAAEIAVAHAHYLSIEFYRIVRIDPHAEEFLSNEQVERQLKSAMERWIINVLSAQVDDVERLIQIQHTVAEVHARIGIPVEIVEMGFRVLKKILYIGIPNGLENSMFQLGKIAVLSLVSGLGTASLAANAVGNNIANFAILPGMSFGFALLTVCAQCVGAGDFEQVKYYTKHMMRVEYLCLIASNLIVILALPFILSVYNLSDEAAQYANDIILYHAACVVTIWPLSFTLPNTLRAAADVKVTMVLSIISMWVFRFGFSYLLTMVFHMGIFGVWVAMTIDWLVRGIFFVCRYKSGRWQKIIFS